MATNTINNATPSKVTLPISLNSCLNAQVSSSSETSILPLDALLASSDTRVYDCANTVLNHDAKSADSIQRACFTSMEDSYVQTQVESEDVDFEVSDSDSEIGEFEGICVDSMNRSPVQEQDSSLAEADDASYQHLFPLSTKHWNGYTTLHSVSSRIFFVLSGLNDVDV